MPFTLTHVLLSETLVLEPHEVPDGRYYTASIDAELDLLYPGHLVKRVDATVRHLVRTDTNDVDGNTPGRRPQIVIDQLPYQLRIFDPAGVEFTRDQVTTADLEKFRDRRGTPVGRWRCTLSIRSEVYAHDVEFDARVTAPRGALQLSLLETVPSASAPPLVPYTRLTTSTFHATFDLNHVGTLVAGILPSAVFDRWSGTIRLLDPDGIEIASSASHQLRVPIDLRRLAKSRDAAGNARPWTLEVTSASGLDDGEHFIGARVLNEGRVAGTPLIDRIQRLIGEHGSFIGLAGQNVDGKIRAVLTLHDVLVAETLDMYGFLDDLLEGSEQSTDIELEVPIVLYERDEHLSGGRTSDGPKLDVGSLALRSIDVAVVPGGDPGLGADTPVLRLDVAVEGALAVRWRNHTVATAKPRDGKLHVELAIKIDADGTPQLLRWTEDDPLDIDVDASVVALAVAAAGVGGLTVIAATEYIEEVATDVFREAFDDLFKDPDLGAKILMTLFGAHLTYVDARFEGGDVLFEHYAAAEPDPKPRSNYTEVIGRVMRTEAAGAPRMPSLGDTWKADNLQRKVEHIVVVMMENRSYDHVLGARALAGDGADGWTPELVAAVGAVAVTPRASGTGATAPQPGELPTTGSTNPDDELPPVHALRTSKLEENGAGRKTRIPKGVGHALAAVQHQLGGTVEGPGGQRINDPRGFTEDFHDHHLEDNPDKWAGCTPFTVLGYYEANAGDPGTDLPITAFLAEHYAYCDRYFCSHAGPTLPNRMYSLTGDVQYDRTGVPILDNNHGDNFLLSRAQTIFDVLTRHGVGWRVYESFPSVAMLRMFARYATDDVNIRRLDDLERDVMSGDLPAVTVIEPAMHHAPEDDDHPDADMYRGQHFLQRVYETLRKNPALWQNTLLIITYDEHGGLYDHVPPPIAERIDAGRANVRDGRPQPGGNSSGGTSPLGTPIGGVGGTGGTTGDGGVALGGGFVFHREVLDTLLPDPDRAVTAPVDILYGVRVPTFVISPWVSPGKGPSLVLDHCSILKTILARFCGDTRPFLSDRISASHSFEAFLDADAPREVSSASPTLTALPPDARRMPSSISEINTPPLFRSRMRREQVDYHELTGRLARQLGR